MHRAVRLEANPAGKAGSLLKCQYANQITFPPPIAIPQSIDIKKIIISGLLWYRVAECAQAFLSE
jgi:hypothetical protein